MIPRKRVYLLKSYIVDFEAEPKRRKLEKKVLVLAAERSLQGIIVDLLFRFLVFLDRRQQKRFAKSLRSASRG